VNLEELYRREYGHILATIIRAVRDFTLAEDVVQDAFAAAHTRWIDELPANPVGWLVTTARNKAVDQLRRRTLAESKHEEMIAISGPGEGAPQPLDSLRLIFTCCHPALAAEAQVALTLHTICGLSTEEIARAFLVPASTMSQRLFRAKSKIQLARIPFEVPDEEALPERVESVLSVIYLVFNEGYAASAGPDLLRADLCEEAIRLGREVASLLPAEPEAKALLALMLLNDARRGTRINADGALVLLEDQDRAQWDTTRIAEGAALVEPALRGGRPGRYALQAAIAALHVHAPSSKATDWPQIAALYDLLARLHPSPVVDLNRAVAIAMAEGPEKGLALMEKIDLPGYHLLPAARAELLRRLGRLTDAKKQYPEALALVQNNAAKQFLEQRLTELECADSSEAS